MRIRERFNPRAPCGARLITWMGQLLDFYISTHAPLAGRDVFLLFLAFINLYFNPRAPCGARPLDSRSLLTTENFNPRAPCGARL